MIEPGIPDIETLTAFGDVIRTDFVFDEITDAVQTFGAVLAEAGKNDIVGSN